MKILSSKQCEMADPWTVHVLYCIPQIIATRVIMYSSWFICKSMQTKERPFWNLISEKPLTENVPFLGASQPGVITSKNAHLISLSDEKSGTILFKALKKGFVENKGQQVLYQLTVKPKVNVSSQVNFRLLFSLSTITSAVPVACSPLRFWNKGLWNSIFSIPRALISI